jgi:hypothetical protein
MSSHIPAVVHVTTSHAASAPQLDGLMLFGSLTAMLMLVFYIEQRRSRGAVLGIAICSTAMALFAFLEGIWPLGIVQIAAAVVSLRKWRRENRPARTKHHNPWPLESRMTRLFGTEPSDHPVKGEWQ